ncbi:ribosome maturation factor RimP [Emcibacter nanhaiensis]|uniref:Ribosome maturation factor RimP n=1 Tax=Emcibacter nanhaiensis TaxID=1505037 RepID=A0A501PNW0_9PROT|nr:ribosome maturation factor RimP [Emcibacter nanhaiensis]TPD61476.1 ribosome maturation factor RimP [Emcibacter nanhaiensis]
MATALTDRITKLVEPVASALGYELVRVAMMGGPYGGTVLQIMAERPDGTMLVEDCEKLSRELSVILDVEDPISGEYTLEVSSPGVDRPLTRKKDFATWAGHVAKFELSEAVDGRRRFKGMLLGIEDDVIRVDVEGETLEFDFGNVHKAKLVLTDELLKKAGSGTNG